MISGFKNIDLEFYELRTCNSYGSRRDFERAPGNSVDLLNEKAALSPEMALRLEKAFGVSMDLLLRMQAWHDAAEIREKAGEIEVEWYIPV